MEDFHMLMEDLGKLLDVTLIPDKHNACVLNFNDEITVQIEPDIAGHSLILASQIGEIPAGKFREGVLATGLQYNAIYPRIGSFAYFAKNNELVFFHTFPLEGLQPDVIEEFLTYFIEQADHWKTSISRGSIPTLTIQEEMKKPSLFDRNP